MILQEEALPKAPEIPEIPEFLREDLPEAPEILLTSEMTVPNPEQTPDPHQDKLPKTPEDHFVKMMMLMTSSLTLFLVYQRMKNKKSPTCCATRNKSARFSPTPIPEALLPLLPLFKAPSYMQDLSWMPSCSMKEDKLFSNPPNLTIPNPQATLSTRVLSSNTHQSSTILLSLSKTPIILPIL